VHRSAERHRGAIARLPDPLAVRLANVRQSGPVKGGCVVSFALTYSTSKCDACVPLSGTIRFEMSIDVGSFTSSPQGRQAVMTLFAIYVTPSTQSESFSGRPDVSIAIIFVTVMCSSSAKWVRISIGTRDFQEVTQGFHVCLGEVKIIHFLKFVFPIASYGE
jgi:hypothetical protein